MTFALHSTVIVGFGIGSIEHAYENGYAYDVRLTTGATMILTASAMKPGGHASSPSAGWAVGRA